MKPVKGCTVKSIDMKTEPAINIQSELIKIHSQFGMTELANYRIEKLFEMYVKQSSPKIKQLEWVEDYGYIKAEMPFFKYMVPIIGKKASLIFYGNKGVLTFDTVDDAKAAAQADFERRVKECLE